MPYKRTALTGGLEAKRTRIRDIILLTTAVLLLLTCPAFSATSIVSYEILDSFYPSNPTRIALDANGTIYVASKSLNRVSAYDSSLTYLGMTYVKSPVSVAVSPSGELFAGSSDGNVYRLSNALAKPFIKVAYPASMAIAGDGSFYVLDTAASLVRVFRPDGTLDFSFGGAGIEPGRFKAPLSIAVSSSKVFVLDKGGEPAAGDYGTTQDASRVQVFALDGTFVDSFGNFGIGDGLLHNALSLAVDDMGNVFISDATEQVVQVFDESGNHQITIYNSEQKFRIPSNVNYRDGKLYVLSILSGRIDVIGLNDRYAVLSAQAEGVPMRQRPCGAEQPAATIVLSNDGPAQADWSAASDASWIVLTDTFGAVPGDSTQAIALSADASGLVAGTYMGNVRITATGAVLDIGVSLIVNSAPEFSINYNPISFTVNGVSLPPEQYVSVEISGDGGDLIGWTAMASAPWIGATPLSGQSDATTLVGVGVSADALAGMDEGDYSGYLAFSADCPAIDDVVAPVALAYTKAGAIEVTANIEEAAYSIEGPVTVQGEGTLTLFDGLPEGDYTIEFQDVPGFMKPASISFALSIGEIHAVSVEYLDLRADKEVLVCRVQDGPQVAVTVHDEFGAQLTTVALPTIEASCNGNKSAEIMNRVACAVGDLDGDGALDIVLGQNGGALSGYHMDGSAIDGLLFQAFDKCSAVELELADLDADARAEIIVGTGDQHGLQDAVRVFSYSGGAVLDTGVNFIAYQKRFGFHMATADLDGDGSIEILTTQGGANNSGAHVRIWKVDTSQGIGKWMAEDLDGFVADTGYYGADISAANLDGLPGDEIVLALSGEDKSGVDVVGFTGDGSRIFSFKTDQAPDVSVVAGDIDFDGLPEIVVLGTDVASGESLVMSYEIDGAVLSGFTPFGAGDIATGASLCLGDTGLH